MAMITPLSAITLLASEIAAVRGATGSEDAPAMIAEIVVNLQEVSAQLTRLTGLVPAGANLTTLQAALTNIA